MTDHMAQRPDRRTFGVRQPTQPHRSPLTLPPGHRPDSSGLWREGLVTPVGQAGQELLPSAQFTQVANAGHFIALERPDVPAHLLNENA